MRRESSPAPFSLQIITCVAPAWPALLAPATGLVGRAVTSGLVDCRVIDLRAFGTGAHQTIDDSPYGGGAGMVLQAPPLLAAIADARAHGAGPVLVLAPRGPTFVQERAAALAAGPGMTLVCGRYEGLDERVFQAADGCLSVGDFVLSGGEPAALCVIDAVLRLRPGTLGNSASLVDESFADGLLQHPQYTRPQQVAGQAVPEVLLTGDHRRIAAWRREQRRQLTEQLRPDLLGVRPVPPTVG